MYKKIEICETFFNLGIPFLQRMVYNIDINHLKEI
jgi:hypothetical protein